jgi:hypothetical protein
MNTPTNHQQGICLRLTMSDLVKEALEKDAGKTSVVLYIVPRSGQPYAATHAIYQGVPGAKGEEHPRVGFARFYRSDAIPAELQTPSFL